MIDEVLVADVPEGLEDPMGVGLAHLAWAMKVHRGVQRGFIKPRDDCLVTGGCWRVEGGGGDGGSWVLFMSVVRRAGGRAMRV